MKNLNLLVLLTQLTMSIVAPLVGFVVLGGWLHKSQGWGIWSVWAGILLGVFCAIGGIRDLIRVLKRMLRENRKDNPPPICFNDHD